MEDFLKSDRYKAAVAQELQRLKDEEAIVETAGWFGATTLPDDIERELPRYLRRELGESLLEEHALKADDLAYLGAFEEPPSCVHYWRLPASHLDQPTFAYVAVSDEEYTFGWSDRSPPDGGC